MREIERKVLALLKRPMTCNEVGENLWGGTGRNYQCTAPYARPAGKIVRRLQKKGLIRIIIDPDKTLWQEVKAAAAQRWRERGEFKKVDRP